MVLVLLQQKWSHSGKTVICKFKGTVSRECSPLLLSLTTISRLLVNQSELLIIIYGFRLTYSTRSYSHSTYFFYNCLCVEYLCEIEKEFCLYLTEKISNNLVTQSFYFYIFRHSWQFVWHLMYSTDCA